MSQTTAKIMNATYGQSVKTSYRPTQKLAYSLLATFFVADS